MKNLTELNTWLMSIDELLDDRSVDEKAHSQILEMIHYFRLCFSDNLDIIDTPGIPRTINQDVLEKATEALALICRANTHYCTKDYSTMLQVLHSAEESMWGMNEMADAS